MYLYIYLQRAFTYYLYAFFPVMFWEEVFVRRRALIEGKNKLFGKLSQQDVMKLVVNVFAYVAILEVMVCRHGERLDHDNTDIMNRCKATITARSTRSATSSPPLGLLSMA